MLLKMTAFTVKQYMSHLPNMIDSLIVAGSILTFGLEAVVTDLRIVKGLRVLRAIKPLRAITRSNGMQIVLRSILLVSHLNPSRRERHADRPSPSPTQT